MQQRKQVRWGCYSKQRDPQLRKPYSAMCSQLMANCSHLAVSLSKWAYYLPLLSVTILTQKGPFLLSKQSTVDNKQDSRPLNSWHFLGYIYFQFATSPNSKTQELSFCQEINLTCDEQNQLHKSFWWLEEYSTSEHNLTDCTDSHANCEFRHSS